MGFTVSKVFNSLFVLKEMRILMLGLDDAGKKTILNRFKSWENITPYCRVIGFNVETVDYKNIIFTSWDLGGYG